MAVWKKLNGNFILTPINMTINACQYLSKNARVPFHANLIMKWVQSFSNINHTCPYSVSIWYSTHFMFCPQIMSEFVFFRAIFS